MRGRKSRVLFLPSSERKCDAAAANRHPPTTTTTTTSHPPRSPFLSSMSHCLFPFPCSRPRSCLPLSLPTLYFGSLLSALLLFLSSSPPRLSWPGPLPLRSGSSIRSEPFVLFTLPSSLLPRSLPPSFPSVLSPRLRS